MCTSTLFVMLLLAMSSSSTHIILTKVCDDKLQGWKSSDLPIAPGWIMCDIQVNPCKDDCPQSKGKIPKEITFGEGVVPEGSEPILSSKCGEYSVPGGLTFVPKSCTGMRKDCLTHKGAIILCVSVTTRINFPLTPFERLESDGWEMIITIISATFTPLILTIVTCWTLKIIITRGGKSFSGVLVELGHERFVDISSVVMGYSGLACVGDWSKGAFHGQIYITRSQTENVDIVDVHFYPIIGFENSDNNITVLELFEYTWWGISRNKLPQINVL